MKTIKFYKNDDIVRVLPLDTETLLDELNPAIYKVCFDPLSGFYLQYKGNRFEVPREVYGSVNKKVNKVISAYEARVGSTGVMLTGDKGSGKTMTSFMICNEMIDKGLPVILIEDGFTGSGFMDILNNIGESVLLFDEFGKVFENKEDNNGNDVDPQQSLLSLFDGANSIKRLMLLTENNTSSINTYMKNRPGRILYHFRYDKLEESVIRQYCGIKNLDDGVINEILYKRDTSFEFSFDVLKAIVEEYLRTGESIAEVCDDLNVEKPFSDKTILKLNKITKDGIDTKYKPEKEYMTFTTRSDNYLYLINGDLSYSVRLSVKNIIKKEDDKLVFSVDGYIIEATSVIRTPTGYVSANIL